MNSYEYPQIFVDVPKNLRMFALEGIDGVGKSEQKVLVIKTLQKLGIKAEGVTTPSASGIGTFLRANLYRLEPWERSTLFLLDMIRILRNHINYDGVLVWDRYKDSSIASNKDMAPEESARWVRVLPDPIRTFLLDMPPEDVYKKRTASLHEHSIDLAWQRMKYRRYHTLVRRNPNRIVVIDADKSRIEVTSIIVEAITSDLRKIGFL
ncbi:MAG: hypothetical protein A2W52_01515 [Candidatus Taylorbacteria bacterium RIFCSPHIGHO2_02_49_25]|uniref:Thymidylate kinase-like domain-containing protein n=2 Tax=Parcubacteria group TaxID=1794811 RepID=A0A1G2MDI2_9BACT|nr:MAG: hypothetical protein UU83_C0003G0005 [Candidatus Jorgensenbacteria bacterium GW2011_GWF2_41_8]OHA21938.1 MAG: hypothetical protein A2W52_01515 [Candidatus Taylorbacteria bacterium RIFCSPHIGHO2_02_49_25]OHA35726.1 MAG: hypothetical protein A2W65_02295 [Candidatus Taylorbacteria bacterium RIFCSPLOWO2_02_50_13]OHA42948.1 MAG: hypothetical protein A3H73_02070 [Candidatus Taylorbacteria bacterium RIFCSPLOWO2_02_FULL_50_120]OHA46250.1 MAG: hypothetical protein A3G61_04265 [Candidatus Taylorba